MRIVIACALSTTLFAADAKLDGAKVHYESYGAGKEAIVFIHGWTCDLTFWRGQAPVYEKHRSLLIDLPGHGQSDKPDISYTQETFARGVDAVLRDAGVDRAILVGHSMGGPVSLTYLRMFPDKVKAIVLVDSFFPTPPKDDKEKAQQDAQMKMFTQAFRLSTYKDTANRTIQAMFSDKTTPEMREEIRTKMTSTPQHVIASAMEGMFTLKAPGETEKHPQPLMAVLASKRPGFEDRLRATFPNLVKYDTWEGSGHFLMMESPARFNAELEEFLSGLKK
jgi:pimeloyl-ACP methyl ester carboxylesterase